MTSWTEEQVQLIESLRGEECPGCGKRKRSRQSFCRVCYFKLPCDLRCDLYKRVGAGYEEAHAQAMHLLEGGKR